MMSAYNLGQTRPYGNVYNYGLWYLGISYIAVPILIGNEGVMSFLSQKDSRDGEYYQCSTAPSTLKE
jgi:hypothetical protein